MILKYSQLELKPSEPALPDEIANLVHLLEEELANSPATGIGLSAPQIGQYKQVFIIRAQESIDVANPKIISLSEPEIIKEGCLSYPGLTLKTLRYNAVTYSDHWHQNRTLRGTSAVVFQHEYQHLLGGNMLESQISRVAHSPLCPCGSTKPFQECCSLAI